MVSEVVFAPAAIAALDALQPVHGTANGGIILGNVGRFITDQDGPGAIDVVGTPATEPGAIRFLFTSKILDGFCNDRCKLRALFLGFGEEHEAAAADVGGRRIQQGAMVGEGDVIQVVRRVVGIKSPPATAMRLHSGDPVTGSSQRLGKLWVFRLQEGVSDDGRIVDIGVVGVFKLECPAAAFDVRPTNAPIPGVIGQLLARKPGQSPIQGVLSSCILIETAAFLKRKTRQARIPDRGDARLAIGFVVLDDQKSLDGFAGDFAVGVIFCIPKVIQRLIGVDHGREDGPEAIDAIQALDEPVAGLEGRLCAELFRNEALKAKSDALEPKDHLAERRLDMGEVIALKFRFNGKEFADVRALGIPRRDLVAAEDKERHHDSA